MIIFILVIILVIAILFFRDTNKELNNLNENGGVIEKYKLLINKLEYENYKLEKVTRQSAYLLWVDIIIKSQFKILHAFRNVVITYEIYTISQNKCLVKKVWEFSNEMNQEEMYKIIIRDIAILIPNYAIAFSKGYSKTLE